MTAVKKKAIKNTRSGKTGENSKDGENSKNKEKSEYLGTTLTQVPYIQYSITF